MKIRKTLRIVIASVLAIACVCSLFACKNTKSEIDDDGKLPLQKTNKRYYFQQGLRTDWRFTQLDPDNFMLNRETGLVCQIAPVKDPVEMTEDEIKNYDFNNDKREVVADVEYTVYYNDGTGINMTDSPSDLVKWLRDPESDFYFNTKHYVDAPRYAFIMTSEPEVFTSKFSKLQFNKITYSFVRDGEDWDGILNVVMNGAEYFIVTYEAKKGSAYNTYMDGYLEIIGDFRKEGWEHS